MYKLSHPSAAAALDHLMGLVAEAKSENLEEQVNAKRIRYLQQEFKSGLAIAIQEGVPEGSGVTIAHLETILKLAAESDWGVDINTIKPICGIYFPLRGLEYDEARFFSEP